MNCENGGGGTAEIANVTVSSDYKTISANWNINAKYVVLFTYMSNYSQAECFLIDLTTYDWWMGYVVSPYSQSSGGNFFKQSKKITQESAITWQSDNHSFSITFIPNYLFDGTKTSVIALAEIPPMFQQI